MKYKLKEHVTDEMLIECGFVKDKDNSDEYTIWYDKNCLNGQEEDDVLIVALAGSKRVKGILQFNYTDRPYETLANYIKDLIELGYVEVVE